MNFHQPLGALPEMMLCMLCMLCMGYGSVVAGELQSTTFRNVTVLEGSYVCTLHHCTQI